jgi:streptogramin lyase
MLTTIAGAGGPQANNWRPEFEGGPATAAVLSSPHIALADREGQVFIADKDSHGVRKIRVDGTIVTAAGVNAPGNGPDDLTPATQVALNQPNGLWVGSDGTVFILDLGNSKVRRLGRDGQLRTLFTVPDGILAGRGLWVSDDEQTAYVASNTAVKRWTPEQGVVNFATGFTSLGNLVVDPRGRVVVADRGGHRVYRLDSQGGRTVIAGTGGTTGGGDGQSAILTALNEVRGVWFLPTGAFFLATHRGSQVWYVDTDGLIHLFLQGLRGGMPAGNGTWFYAPSEPRVSECRAVTVDPEGNVLVTENDAGYVRKITFLPFR